MVSTIKHTAIILLLGLVALFAAAGACGGTGDLADVFANPPPEARPCVWYHVMNGNATREGLTKDFEAMAHAGIGGATLFDVGCNLPAGPILFASPEWFGFLEHAVSEAKRLGLELSLANCAGWSSSGGPWVTPAEGMKFVTFSRTDVKGPQSFSAVLPREKKDNGFYADIAVVAFPTPASGRTIDGLAEKTFAKYGKIEKGQRSEVRGQVSRSRSREDDNYQLPTTNYQLPEVKGQVSRSRSREEIIRPFLNLTFNLDLLTHPSHPSTIDLTKMMAADGTLRWQVPEGDWTILRFGCICNGRHNKVPAEGGDGLEIDKLSAEAAVRHFNAYIGRLCDRVASTIDGKAGLTGVLIDSYEVGMQNWTVGMEREFAKRRGYDIVPWLPAIAGFVVEGEEASERFLRDFRQTVGELFAENYAGTLARCCHARGLQLIVQPYGNMPVPAMAYGREADVPMCEFWSYTSSDGPRCVRATRGCMCAPSLAHVWGRRFAAAEACTAHPDRGGRWLATPFSIKAMTDSAMANGINRLYYHRFAHQPWTDDRYLPGMTMGRWGVHFDRTQTWWHDFAPAFFRYQARCQAMLQRGENVAQVLVAGDNREPSSWPYSYLSKLPTCNGVDYCDATVLGLLRVEEGRIVSPGGAHYDMLYLMPDKARPADQLQAVRRLKDAGGKVSEDATFAQGIRRFGIRPDAVARIFGDEAFSFAHRSQELEEVVSDKVVSDKVKGVNIPSLITHHSSLTTNHSSLTTNHSPTNYQLPSTNYQLPEVTDWYFLTFNNATNGQWEVSFDVAGCTPEIWNAEDGTMKPAKNWRTEDGRTCVTLDLPPSGSAFVVFRKGQSSKFKGQRGEKVEVEKVGGQRNWSSLEEENIHCPPPPLFSTFSNSSLTTNHSSLTTNSPSHLSHPSFWRIDFPSVGEWTITNLVSWTESNIPDIRYFSGTATYTARLALATPPKKGSRVILNLGTVREFAQVTVNGHAFAPLWRPPYEVDITDALRKDGTADLAIRVTNLWPNRLIGDDRLYADDCEWRGKIEKGVKEIAIRRIPDWVKEGRDSPTGRHTFTTWKHWDKNDELLPSGLLGPVRVEERKK